MRRLLAPLLAGALLVPAVPSLADHVTARPLTTACPANQVSAATFDDVAATSPFELAISCLAGEGITRGRTASSYDPASSVQRQQMAQFLYRLGGRGGVWWDSSDAGFTDLGDVSTEARTAINALANAGIAQGRSAQVFDPSGVVTRGQMASFLARLADAAGAQGFTATADAFDDDEGVVHEQSIDRIAAAGVTAGRGSDRFFEPHDAVTREQMAAFLARTLDRFVAQGLSSPRYRDDVAPVAIRLDQAGQLVEPGSALTGEVTGDRVRSVRVSSPCVGNVDVDRQFSVATDRQAPIGRCPVTVTATLDNGRAVEEPLSVVMPGYTERPELVHVERVGTSTAAGFATSEVRFLYDAPVTPGAANSHGWHGFFLNGYVAGFYEVATVHVASGVRQDGSHALVATFGTPETPVGSDELRAVSYAAADRGAALDAQRRPAPVGNALLNPSSTTAQAFSGPTWAADLLSVTGRRPDPADASRFLVDFTFDAPFEDPVAGGFTFDVVLHDASGRSCRPLTTGAQRQITASCDGAGTTGADGEIARGLVTASRDYGVRPLSGTVLTRRPTAAPDLTAVRWGPGPNEATFVFDEPVRYSGDARLFRSGGPRHLESSYALEGRQPADPHQVVVTLQGEGIDNSTTASVRGAAVVSRSTGRANAFEQVWVPARNPEVVPAGRTTGPDLVRVTAGPDAPPVRHDFDSTLRQRLSGDDFQNSEDEVDLRLYLPDGTELVCDSYEYPFRYPNHADQPLPPDWATYVRCLGYSVADPAGEITPVRATNEQIRAGVYASASYNTGPRALAVDGARR